MKRPSFGELRGYTSSEDRLRESLFLRCHGLPHHSYPGRSEDLACMQAFHNRFGMPPVGLARWWWWLKRSLWGEVDS